MAGIDKKIGTKIKELRKGSGLSQIELAERVGISFQQIQKYEKGVTRMSVFRLCQISEVLGIQITEFLKEGDFIPQISGPASEYTPEESPRKYFRILNQEEITLLKLFRQIKNKKLRAGLLKQIRGVVELEAKTAKKNRVLIIEKNGEKH